MTHRLMKSIVFGSTLLLVGTAACGGISLAEEPEPEVPNPGPSVFPEDPTPTAPVVVDSSVADAARRDARAPDASSADASRDAAVTVILDAGADARHCENGWPTTKGQICTFENGLECCSRSGDPNPKDLLCCPVAVP